MSLAGSRNALDDLDLVRLVGEQFLAPSSIDISMRTNGWFGLTIVAHLGLDRLEVVVAERLAAGQIEVVVEAVLDGGPIENLAPGNSRVTACARTCAVEWRSTWRPSSVSSVMIADRRRRRAAGAVRSVSVPSTVAATAALSSRLPIEAGQIERRRALGQLALGSVGEGDR